MTERACPKCAAPGVERRPSLWQLVGALVVFLLAGTGFGAIVALRLPVALAIFPTMLVIGALLPLVDYWRETFRETTRLVCPKCLTEWELNG